jgi:homoprotocatechuate degradation regulator HpaR
MQLLRARDAVMVRFRPHLKALGLTDQQGRILRVLAEAERLEMGELAERTCIHPASLSRIIPRLHKRGIVRRWKDRDDARRVAVSITTRGRASFAIILAESERIYADLAAEIGAGRMRALYRCLDILIETRQPAATKKPARRSTDAASWAAADPG